MMKRVVKSVLILGVLTSMTTVVYATPHIGGSNLNSQTYTSQYCDITTPNYPAVYSNSGSSAYDMLETTGTLQFVQVGWVKGNQQGKVADGVHYFSEYQDHVTWSTVGPAQGSTHGYRIAVQNGYYVCTADDATIASWPVGFTATGYEFEEELNGNIPYNAQFAGQASYHAKFANLRVFSNGTTYYSPYLNQSTDSNGQTSFSNYSVGYAPSTIELWDARY